MKALKTIVFAIIASVSIIACKQTESNKDSLKTVELSIEGMTCQVGCARMIQSKVAKMDGVDYASVNFEDKKGVFTYDSKEVSEAKIIEKINGIADGELYKVTANKEVALILPKK